MGLHEEVVAALRGPVLAVAVGATTAGPLTAAGVPTAQPERSRLGALAREVVARLPERDPVLRVGGADLQVRGYAAVLDGRLVELPPASMAVLRALAARPGGVVAQADLAHGLPGGGDGRAVETAVTHLRAALGPGLVETVAERDYRLRI
jgi:uroporphyrinogen-III synthase